MMTKRFITFALIGGLNTLLTYAVYLALHLITPYYVAFTLSFILGIGIAYTLNSLFVFKVQLRPHSALSYPFIYLAQYAIATGMLALEVERMGLDSRIMPLINACILLPLSFAMNKWFLNRGTPS